MSAATSPASSSASSSSSTSSTSSSSASSTNGNQDVYMGPNLNVILTCPECKVFPPELVERFSEGDIVCGLCGLVLKDRLIDTRSEWRTFSNDDQNGDDPSRVGQAFNPLLDGDQLSTMISYSKENGKTSRDLSRTQSKSIVEKKDNLLQAAYSKISSLCDGFHLTKNVSDGAKEIYKLVNDERVLKGKSQESIMAASIFLACRKARVNRTFKEIWSLTNIPEKEIFKVFQIINKILLAKSQEGLIQNNAPPAKLTSAEDLIGRYCSNLGLTPQVANVAEHIAKKSKDVGVLAGKSPITVAAGSIYMAARVMKVPIETSMISNKIGVSGGTLKSSYKSLYEKRVEKKKRKPI
ncbi:hypothetical protein PACTADRAFT_683 [Pachysolen tannophilus NRRL Y-2460]|uniref:Transcription initiation factor IIB n=1 Tax=Pachysolen tannophilus NRRL Y-2460 TaxID=669874 RepID=A0A1E4U2G2_PACTA|nr:hypothetical protein PACTADRAFT_683 [Pachysolen tannophilus NRRL Y-2460]